MRAPEKLSVLVADDDLLAIQVIMAAVEHLGHEIVGTASDGERAVEMALSLRPDLVLMDVEMPVLDGVEACRLIQESFPLPVVMLTIHDSMEVVQRASEVGAGAYLIKPVDIPALDRAITVSRARFGDLVELRKLNVELAHALAQVEVLRGIIPICMFCKNIRDDHGFWARVEAYVRCHSTAQFSHGICPTCFEKRALGASE